MKILVDKKKEGISQAKVKEAIADRDGKTC